MSDKNPWQMNNYELRDYGDRLEKEINYQRTIFILNEEIKTLKEQQLQQKEEELNETQKKFEISNVRYVQEREKNKELDEELRQKEEQLKAKINGETSDGYHTFNELYEHRFILTKQLFNSDKANCLKSKLHDDGAMFDNYFIVGIKTFLGWATYHYHISKWDDFLCEEVDYFPKWDGHTATDSINRINSHFEAKNNNFESLKTTKEGKDE